LQEMEMKKYFTYIILILILTPTLFADSFSLSFSQNMTDNLFQNRYAEKDQLSTISYYLDKTLNKFSLYAEGSYSYLFENPTLTYYLQDAGMDYIYPLNEKSAFYFSLGVRGAFYRSDYSDFNYLSANFFTAFKSYLSQTSIIKTNYSLVYKNYRDSFYDFISNSLMVSVDKYLQTKTTLRGEFGWGYKYFLHPYFYEEEVLTDTHRYFMGKRGKGNPSGQTQYPSQTLIQTEGQGIQVFSLSGLIAQGLGNNVGLRISGMRQWVISGQNPFSFIEEFYTVENPSYDRFSWDGFKLGSQLTFLLPWNIQTKLGYTVSEMAFLGIESLDLEGNPLGIIRKDKRNRIEVSAEKNFSRFSVILSYFYVGNSSNDLYFDWSGHFISLGVEWNMPLGVDR
jgi:hypothetical protein